MPTDDELRQLLVDALERHDPVEQWFSESFGEDNHFPTIAALAVGEVAGRRGHEPLREALEMAFEHVFGAAPASQPPFFLGDTARRLDRVVAECLAPAGSDEYLVDHELIEQWCEQRNYRALSIVLPVWIDHEDGLATDAALELAFRRAQESGDEGSPYWTERR